MHEPQIMQLFIKRIVRPKIKMLYHIQNPYDLFICKKKKSNKNQRLMEVALRLESGFKHDAKSP